MARSVSEAKVNPVRPILALLESYGVDSEDLFSATALQTVPREDVSDFTAEQILLLLSEAARLSGDPLFALNLGRRMDHSGMGTLGFAIKHCASVGQVLKFMVRYNVVFNLGRVWELYPMNAEIAMRFAINYGTGAQRRMLVEASFAQFFSLRHLVAEPFEVTAVHFGYPRPEHHKRYSKYMSAPCFFDQPCNQIVFSEKLLDLPVKTANPGAFAIFEKQCEEMLRGLGIVKDTTAQVRRALMLASGEIPNLEGVSRQLHVSESTLRRRLHQEGTSFRAVLDDVKNLLAKEYLLGTEITVADIAQLLGYTDTANFRRAFVRWNGLAPGHYRDACQK